jgi:putative phosphoribosyl transferase
MKEDLVKIKFDKIALNGNLTVPKDAIGIVLFAHGSGSGRHSPRNQYVARQLESAGLATLLIDLLTEDEERVDMETAHLRFDIPLLAQRLEKVTDWLKKEPKTAALNLGYFGASTGAAAALMAAAVREDVVAIVSRGGRPDLAGNFLPKVQAPVLLIVGGEDYPVIEMNREALAKLRAEKKLVIVPKATHLFEEPGTLEEVARLAAEWFTRYLHRR